MYDELINLIQRSNTVIRYDKFLEAQAYHHFRMGVIKNSY